MLKKITPLGFVTFLCLFTFTQTQAQSILKIIDQTTQQQLSDVAIEERWTNPQSGKLNIIKGQTNAMGEYELHAEITQYQGQVIIHHVTYQPREITSFELLDKGYTIGLTPSQIQINEVVVLGIALKRHTS